jgi:hypothetical protein
MNHATKLRSFARSFVGFGCFASFGLTPLPSKAETNEAPHRGAIVATGKIGGIAPFSKLSFFAHGAVELGYAFGSKRRFMTYLEASYTVPTADGKGTDARVPGETWKWEIWQKQLVLQPTFAYRMTAFSPSLTPYVGIGPRVYFLETVTEGSADGEALGTTSEQSTKLGIGLPLGIEWKLGPGNVLGEFQFQWAPLDHRITGETNLGAATLFLGYRAYL